MPAEPPLIRSAPIRRVSRLFIGFGSILAGIFPATAMNLKISGMGDKYDINAREYLSLYIFVSSMLFVFISSTFAFIFYSIGGELLFLAPILGFIVAFFIFFQILNYPSMIVNKRVADIDRNLLYVLRTILVQIRSGVPIFDTFVSISTGDYGEISKEFGTVMEKVRTGKAVTSSLEELAVRNPSKYFRRALWQLVNAMKSGGDVGDNIANVINSLAKEQLIEIRRYQSTLNPLAMMYMMVAVIAPSLGITMLIILSTFMGDISEEQMKLIFWGLLGFVIIMQFMFMIIIKSKRPNLMGR